MSKPGIARSNKYMKMTELDHISCFAVSIYIFIGLESEKDYSGCFLFDEFRHSVVSIRYLFCFMFSFYARATFSGSFMSDGFIYSTNSLESFAKCHALLECPNLLLMLSDVLLKVMRTTYCHLEKGECEVKERQLKDNQAERKTDIRTRGRKEGTLDAYSLQHTVHPLTRAFKVTKMKKQNQNLQVPLFPLPDYHHPLSSSFCFFSPPLFLFLSLSLSSPSVVSLIGRQTACKCSNPEKSPGALVIGCALQHCSQSIKAR